MKNHAQAILQFSDYPLEPIVALEVKKSYDSKLVVASRNYTSPHYARPQQKNLNITQQNWDEAWFGNYE